MGRLGKWTVFVSLFALAMLPKGFSHPIKGVYGRENRWNQEQELEQAEQEAEVNGEAAANGEAEKEEEEKEEEATDEEEEEKEEEEEGEDGKENGQEQEQGEIGERKQTLIIQDARTTELQERLLRLRNEQFYMQQVLEVSQESQRLLEQLLTQNQKFAEIITSDILGRIVHNLSHSHVIQLPWCTPPRVFPLQGLGGSLAYRVCGNGPNTTVQIQILSQGETLAPAHFTKLQPPQPTAKVMTTPVIATTVQATTVANTTSEAATPVASTLETEELTTEEQFTEAQTEGPTEAETESPIEAQARGCPGTL